MCVNGYVTYVWGWEWYNIQWVLGKISYFGTNFVCDHLLQFEMAIIEDQKDYFNMEEFMRIVIWEYRENIKKKLNDQFF